jgi:thiamine-phosphate pyrophosphorylase
LYLVLNVTSGDAAGHRKALPDAAAAGRIATVLLRSPAGAARDTPLLKSLIETGQKLGIAMLLADDAAMARALKADGVHLSWSKEPLERFREARETLGQHGIVGADAGRSRHDAMELGEGGADYIAFGIPPHVDDITTARERQADLVSWWSDIFEIPCVAFDVASLEEAHDLASAGADFVAVTLPDAATETGPFVKALVSAVMPEGATA